jgi:Tol biopolymer transport system component
VPAGLVAQLVTWDEGRLVATEQPRGFPYSASATISPDGTRVAYVPRDLGGGDIFVAEIDGTRHTNLTNSPEDDEPPLWSPDSGRLAFISHGPGDRSGAILRVIGAITGAPLATLELPSQGFQSLAWLPDGSGFSFLAAGAGGTQDVFVLHLDGTLEPLTESPASEIEAAVSPGVDRVAVVRVPVSSPSPPTPPENGTPGTPATELAAEETQAGETPTADATPASSATPILQESSALWLVNISGSEYPISTPGLSSFSHLRWSPDGGYLSFLAKRESGAESLYVLEPETGAAPRVAFARARIDEWTWSPDSRHLAVVAGGGACGRTCPRGFLHLVDLETGRVQALPDIRVVSAVAWGWE